MVTPETLVDDKTLGALLGISGRRVRQWAEQGIIQRADRGLYQLGPCLQALLENASGTGSQLQRERIRKTAADADMAELQYAVARKEVAPITEFGMVQRRSYAIIRANVMNVPQRVVVQLLGVTDETEFKRKLKAELTLALVNSHEGIKAMKEEDLFDEELES